MTKYPPGRIVGSLLNTCLKIADDLTDLRLYSFKVGILSSR